MKVFVCSDVHGNARALQAVLAVYREERARGFLFLGDCVGYGAHPGTCLDILFNLPHARLILGNHDAALLDPRQGGDLNDLAAEAIDWTISTLKGRYDAAMRRRFVMQYKNVRYEAVHASPHHPDEWTYILSALEAEQAFCARSFGLCFVGHTHIPALYAFGAGETALHDKVPFRLQPGMRYIINPGSVGQPRDGDPRSACCIFDTDEGTITLRRCEYNVAAEAQDIINAGLPRYLGQRLLHGA